MGYPQWEEDSSAKVATLLLLTHPPSLLPRCRWHRECSQPHFLLKRWSTVFMEPGQPLPATGTPPPSESRYPGHSLQESLELVSRGAKQVAVTALSFPSNDVNKFIVGSQECTAYQVYSCCCMCVCFCVSLDLSQGQRHGSKPGLAVQFDGHHGPVTSVSCHRATGGQYDLSHLFLTSSFDWTVKLWSTKLQNEQQLTVSTCTESHKLPDSCFPCVEQDREPSLFI